MESDLVPSEATDLLTLRSSLLGWYDRHRRNLPWRFDTDPYRVWVSEIMLQQTRVAAVLEHYARFLERFPTVQSLAAAREQSVLAMWSGLGYYHRARRMHQAAKLIVREREGNFPGSAEEWLELPGIGRYTAAAIASIAFGEPVAVVDGNVERVLARMFGRQPSWEAAWQQAAALLIKERPGDFNQAMMELGATICTPRAPQCLLCPLRQWCVSRGADIPRRQAPRKRKTLCYGLARKRNSVLLMQRPSEASLMAGMWELPLLESVADRSTVLATFRHSITDTDYGVSVIAASPKQLRKFARQGRWVTPREWLRLPLTGLTGKILRKLAE
jgi:A/G-specific adenine glycosylase